MSCVLETLPGPSEPAQERFSTASSTPTSPLRCYDRNSSDPKSLLKVSLKSSVQFFPNLVSIGLCLFPSDWAKGMRVKAM